MMKRKIGKVIKLLMILVFIGGAAFGGYRLYTGHTAANTGTASAESYTRASVTAGSITQSVISTGSLSISGTAVVKAPVDIAIDSVDVQAGETVAAGTALFTVDADALYKTLKSLESQIAAQDSVIISLASRLTSTKTLTAPIASRVKAINVAAGQSLQAAIDADPALMVLSLDGLMNVEIPDPGTLALNASVTVNGAGRTYAGTVARLGGGKAIITFPDTKVNIGESVQVLQSSAVIGSGVAQVNMPYIYGTTVKGLVDSVKVSLNASVTKGTPLIYAVNVEATDEYNDAVELRAELQAKLDTARALYKDPVIRAEKDGIISVVSAAAGSTVPADTVLLTMYVGSDMQMVISVDELDIINVAKGQTASVVMDALPKAPYSATVTYVSQIGTASSGITNYSVTLDIAGDSKLKLGMNGTATIHIGEQSNVLLVPLAAVQDDKQGSYVWKYDESHTATDEEPGIKTYITTGLSNSDYAAVTSGLKPGDTVLVVRTAAVAAASDTATDPGAAFGAMGGGQMPSGEMPSGGSFPEPGAGGFGGNGQWSRPGN